MATANLGGFSTARQLLPPDTDAELLRRFALDRDDEAFARLVTRYGRLVLAACRRIVPDAHLADDAFQAAFVVLARKAHALDGTHPLGPWLYGVAVNVASRARHMLGRRRKRETLTDTVPERAAAPELPDDAAGVLDEEVAALPAAQRAAVVLCELQGLSRKEAAQKLRVAEGTLSSRLAAARKKLAARLTARGVSPVAAVAVGAVPPVLHAATTAAATGKVPPGARVRALVREGMAMTLLTTLKVGAALAVLAVLLAFGGRRGDETTAAPVPRDGPDPGLIWLEHAKSNELVGYKPNGTKVKTIDARAAHLDLRRGLIWKYDPKGGTVTGFDLDGRKVREVASPGHFIGFSDDGKTIMFAGKGGKPWTKPEEGPLWLRGCTLHLRDVGGTGDVVATDIPLTPSGWFHWLPGGRRVIKVEPMTMKSYVLHYLFDAETKKTTSLEGRNASPHIDPKQMLCGVSPDGEWLLARRIFSKSVELSKVPFWGGAPEPLASVGLDQGTAELSPDGRFVACLGIAPRGPGKVPGGVTAVRVVDVRTGEVTEGTPHEDGGRPAGVAWAPDGRSLAYLLVSGDADRTRLSLIACDARGRDARTVLTLDENRRDEGWNGWKLIGWYPAPPRAAPPRR
ncbi:MAG: sigma-70 family RNA polymerase sigma factor [Planctomycetes bacterium]|nr:sigma-70 family RNA polymerase sigma factor [Planctomycetota bacterium]